MGKIMYKGQEFQGKIERTNEGLDIDFYVPLIELGTSQTNMIFTELGTLTEYTGGDMSWANLYI